VDGLIPSKNSGRVVLLVTDDRALSTLAELLGQARTGTVNVFVSAPRCAALLDAHPAWSAAGPTTAMVCGELSSLSAPGLPGGLTMRPVARLPGDPADAVALEDAVALVAAVDATVAEPDEFAAYLRSLPSEWALLAAVNADGAVCATSGGGAFGSDATVIFVNTDPRWRGRGVATAMTAAALLAAREAGATRAVLDATDPARGIYARLGFEVVTRTTRYSMRDPQAAGNPTPMNDRQIRAERDEAAGLAAAPVCVAAPATSIIVIGASLRSDTGPAVDNSPPRPVLAGRWRRAGIRLQRR
jgi:ribosomal protein S18 acetylase RimI-like enzyme